MQSSFAIPLLRTSLSHGGTKLLDDLNWSEVFNDFSFGKN
jgi:hypothetical protein